MIHDFVMFSFYYVLLLDVFSIPLILSAMTSFAQTMLQYITMFTKRFYT